MSSSWAPLFGSLLCLVVVCCCVLTSLIPNELREELNLERDRFWGHTSSSADGSTTGAQASGIGLRQDPLSTSNGYMQSRNQSFCQDTKESCRKQASTGDCQERVQFMQQYCPKSCRFCKDHTAEPEVFLLSGHSMPLIGFGTAGLGEATAVAVAWALQAGYRLIDTAQAREWYREDFVGAGISSSEVSRDQLFLTSKLHPKNFGLVSSKLQETLHALNTTYLDLYLLHYPRCWEGLCGNVSVNGTWQSAYKDMEVLVAEGKVHSLGVSNFAEQELEELMQIASVKPSVVQSYSDLFHAEKGLQRFCRANHIQFQAYSTLGTQWMMQGHSQNPVLNAPEVVAIASAHNTSTAHVAMRWALQSGQAIIPRSGNQGRIVANLKVLESFVLSKKDMQELDRLDGTFRAPEL